MAGGFEAIKISVTLKLSLGFGEALLLSLTSCLLCGLLAVALSLPAGLLAQVLSRDWMSYRRHALSLALVSVGLGVYYLLPAAGTLLEQERPQAAVAFALTPIGVGGVVWFNALFWLRREYIDEAPRLGWWFWSAAGALLLSLASAGWMSQRELTRAAPIVTDPDVLIITVDTLRRDHLSVYGEDPWGTGGPPVQTPVFDGLAAAGIRFDNAITPMPETLPAHSGDVHRPAPGAQFGAVQRAHPVPRPPHPRREAVGGGLRDRRLRQQLRGGLADGSGSGLPGL